jgi:hypothetical protein
MSELRKGSCHCGAVQFEITLREGLENPRRCNCSLCRRKGAIMADIDEADMRIIDGEDNLTMYQWNTHVAKHWFCRICGIYTHHKKRSFPVGYGFNIACIDGLDPFSLDEIPVANGVSLSLVKDNRRDGEE